MKRYCALLFALALFCLCSAQQRPLRFQHLTAKDGLSQGHVLCMIQDSRGYIWAGTYNGLNRYNGYNFDVFYADPDKPNSLFINVVFSLYESRDKKIWCGTWGVDVYDPLTDSFTHIPAIQGPKSISAGEVSRIVEDAQGNMWFATQGGGLNKYNPRNGDIKVFRANDAEAGSLKSDWINDIVLDAGQNLWIATEGGGLSRMKLPDESITNYRCDRQNSKAISSDKISCLFLDKDQNLWFGDNYGNLGLYSSENENFTTFSCCTDKFEVNQVRILEITQGLQNDLLLATNGAGLVVFNLLSRTSRHYLHHSDNPESLISNENSSILVDRNGTLFVGSFGRGISKYSPFSNKFDVFEVKADKKEVHEINAFTDAIEDSRGNLVAGTYDGFFVFNPVTWEYTHYHPGNTYEDNKILTIKLAPDRTIWIASMKGLHRYDPDYNKIRSYNLDPSLKDQSIYAIEFDRRNNLWIGLFTRGLLKIEEEIWRNKNLSSLDYKLYLVDYTDTTTIPGNQQWVITADHDSGLWVGGLGGLAKYNYSQDNFTRVFTEGTVKTIDIDSRDHIWIGTIGTGLYYLDLATGKTKRYTTKDGLIHSFIYGVVADSRDDIWISSEGGLSRFNPASETFRTYDRRDGLPDDHFDDKSESRLSDGRIYMGTNNGFILFDPLKIQDDTTSSKVVLTNLSINNEPLDFYLVKTRKSKRAYPVSQLSRIELSPSQKDIELKFAALHFAAPHKIQYKYKLEGYDSKWIFTNADQRAAKYTNLDGGQYRFIVQATNSDGYWSDQILEVEIIVHPPFHQTNLFKILLLLTAVLAVYLIFQWRISSEVRQKKILTQKVEERTNEISTKNRQLEEIASDLKKTNRLLKERQHQILEQSEELAAQRDELAHSNATKDKLFSIIAHDLKNPFNVILGYTELLQANFAKWDNNKITNFLSLLKNTSETAYRLLENLLHWSRNQSGIIPFHPKSRTVNEIIMIALDDVRGMAENKQVKINTEIEDTGHLEVFADLNMLTLILRNLITNSIKFSEKGSSIFIDVTRFDKDFALFAVRDKGVGIVPEELDNLFGRDRYKTTPGTESEKGTGLGLVLCKDFVDIHKGKIWCKSLPGSETAFYFTIPLRPQK
jgi:signal transduction histidine kinase/ligand-binding sensor domain-containing protein